MQHSQATIVNHIKRKNMEINYYILVPVLIVILAGIIYLIRRNRKDKKRYEKEVNAAESTVTEKHDRERV